MQALKYLPKFIKPLRGKAQPNKVNVSIVDECFGRYGSITFENTNYSLLSSDSSSI